MTQRRSDRIRRQAARACSLAAGLLISASAFSADLSLAAQDLPPPQATSPQAQQLISKTNLAIARLQDITNRASELATQALAMLGINYRYGGNTPDTGLDCSGLVRYVFKEAWGTDLPRTSLEISRVGEKIGKDNLQPGDLVFYNTLRRGFSHVGIYLGDGKFIHSPRTGETVRIEDINISYWARHFTGARRVPELADAGSNSGSGTSSMLASLKARFAGQPGTGLGDPLVAPAATNAATQLASLNPSGLRLGSTLPSLPATAPSSLGPSHEPFARALTER